MRTNFICPRCQGIIVDGIYPAGQVSMTVEGQRFHFYCGWKEQERLKEKALKEAKAISEARKPNDLDDFGSAR